MKRILVLLVALALTTCATAVAETDLSTMTDDEIMSLMRQCSTELRSRRRQEETGILVFERDGIRVYQTGDAYLKNGRIEVPVSCYNDTDVTASIDPVFVTCNGVTVNAYGSTWITAGAKVTCELDFATKDLQLTFLEDVYELNFQWKAYSPDKGVLFLTEEAEEHCFW